MPTFGMQNQNQGLSLIAGLVQGFAQKKMQDRKFEMEKPARDAAAAKAKLELQQMKLTQDFLKTIQPFAQNKAQQQSFEQQKQQQPETDAISPTKPTTVFGDSFNVTETPGVGVLDQMVGGPPPQAQQVEQPQAQGGMQMNPQTAMALEMASDGGIPAFDMMRAQTSEASLQQRIKAEKRLERQGQDRIDIQQKNLELEQNRFDRQEGEFKQLIVKNLDGSTTTMLVPKFMGGGLGAVTTVPPSKKLRIKDADLPLWINLETLQTPAVGITPEEAQANGFVRVTTGQKEAVKGFATTEVVIDKIDQLMGAVFPKEGGVGERITGGPMRGIGAVLQSNQKAAELDSLIKGTLAPIIRALGEKGALSDTDVKRAINLLPALTDSADVAWGKIQNLKDLFAASKESVLGATIEKAAKIKKNTAQDFMSR